MRATLTILFLIFSLFANAQADGQLDSSFNKTGKLTLASIAGQTGNTISIALPDGKYLVGGTCMTKPRFPIVPNLNAIAVMRFLHNGTVDSSFGIEGTCVIDSLRSSKNTITSFNMALQPNGKILVVTEAGNARLDTNGNPDLSFGPHGVVRGEVSTSSLGHMPLSILADGSFFIGYYFTTFSFNTSVVCAKFKANGTIDSSFAKYGADTLNFSGRAALGAINVQPDGKLLCTGGREGSGSTINRLMCFRLKASGTLDSVFASNGIFLDNLNVLGYTNMEAKAAVLQPDGKLVVGVGMSKCLSTVRFNPTGVLDSSYGVNGVCRIVPKNNSFAYIYNMLLRTDGEIVVSGNVDTAKQRFYAVARITTLGLPDSSFGLHSYVLDTFTHNWHMPFQLLPAYIFGDQGESISQSLNGDILLTSGGASGQGGYHLAGYDSMGKLRSQFGRGGKTIELVGRAVDGLLEFVIPIPNGKILIAGTQRSTIVSQRNSDGSLDAAFGTNGILEREFPFPDSTSYLSPDLLGLVRSPSGKFYVAIRQAGVYSSLPIIIARFHASGTIDSSYGKNGYAKYNMLGKPKITLQPDGKLLLWTIAKHSFSDSIDIIRLRTNGNIDYGFANNGRLSFSFVGFGAKYARGGNLITLRNKKLLLCTEAYYVNNSDYYLGLVRLNSDGSPDVSFGPRGLRVVRPLQTNYFNYYDGIYYNPVIKEDSLARLVATFSAIGQGMFRFDANLKIDSSFGDNGYVQCPAGYGGDYHLPYYRPADMVIQPDNKPVLGHFAYIPPFYNITEDSSRFSILRYKVNGTLDSAFGVNGQTNTQISRNGNIMSCLALAYDGKLLAAGWSQVGYNTGFAVARYHLGIPPIDTALNHGDSLDTIALRVAPPLAATEASFYPNPVAEAGVLSYSLTTATKVGISIVDINGNKLLEVVHEQKAQGIHHKEIVFPTGAKAGTYFIALRTDRDRIVLKVLRM
jgi:uncharacterized delta-60 repeat protein